jgi:formylglycine-generating enzyme required for sulfatase activity
MADAILDKTARLGAGFMKPHALAILTLGHSPPRPFSPRVRGVRFQFGVPALAEKRSLRSGTRGAGIRFRFGVPALAGASWKVASRSFFGKRWAFLATILFLCLSLSCFGVQPASSAEMTNQAPPKPAMPATLRWTNSLGMVFTSITNANPLFAIWETRVQDFDAFVKAAHYNAGDGTMALPRATHAKQDWRNPGFPQGPTHPVVMVSWEDAREFCQWLTTKERAAGKIGAGNRYRLPTDAEWSQAVGKGLFPWSDVLPPSPAQAAAIADNIKIDERRLLPPPTGAGNYAGIDVMGTNKYGFRYLKGYDDGYARTSPVGSFAPNAFGLYDLGGNVWEWCEDWFRKDMVSVEMELKLPYANNDGGGRTYRMLRGASWLDSNAAVLLSECRFFEFPDHHGDTIGFRVVLEGRQD